LGNGEKGHLLGQRLFQIAANFVKKNYLHWQKEVNSSVLGSRARWFESVPERSDAKDPAPLKLKEVWVKERRYIVCLNEEDAVKMRAIGRRSSRI
jgi:hypothetical protein